MEKMEVHKQIQLLNRADLSDEKLLQYLKSRAIDGDVAKHYCKQIDYQIQGDNRKHTSIAFNAYNSMGGHYNYLKYMRKIGYQNMGLENVYYELLNSEQKLYISANGSKDISFIGEITCENPDYIKNFGNISVFNDFIDFLSYKSNPKMNRKEENYLILNNCYDNKNQDILLGIETCMKILEILSRHNSIHLYLNNDKKGRDISNEIYQIMINKGHNYTYNLCSLYKNYKSLNEWWVSEQKKQTINQNKRETNLISTIVDQL
jgi:hypothetical protein